MYRHCSGNAGGVGLKPSKLLAIDLFSGAGGMSLGFELAGVDVVAAVEFDDKAMCTYRRNFPGHLTYLDDICNVDAAKVMRELEEIGIDKLDIDLIIGGPPCPGFSNIGRSKIIGLLREKKWKWGQKPPKGWRHQFIQDPRNKLFLEFVRFVKEFEPRGFIMENVPGMLTSKDDSGRAIVELVKDSFSSVGYECEFQILSADDYGVPQSRKRIIFIGWKKDSPQDKFHHPPPLPGPIWTSLEAISDLPPISQEGGAPIGEQKKPQNEFQKDMRFRAYRDANREDQRTDPPKIPRQSVELSCHIGRWVNPRDRAIFPKLQAHENGERVTYDMIEPQDLVFPSPWRWNKSKEVVWNGELGKKRKEYKWYSRKSFKDKMRRIPHHKPSPTLVAHMGVDTYMYIHPEPNTHRTITPQEAARIQSFPDSFDFGRVNFTSQYRQIGNAVPPLMAKAIALEIKKAWRIE